MRSNKTVLAPPRLQKEKIPIATSTFDKLLENVQTIASRAEGLNFKGQAERMLEHSLRRTKNGVNT